MRVAIYWAPRPGSALWEAGSLWLGRDAQSAAARAQPAHDGIAALTADARRYGFHATLRPPMRLRGAASGAAPMQGFMAAAGAVASEHAPFTLPPLQVSLIGGFVAITLTAPSRRMQALADACVLATNPYREPASAEELQRRRRAGLDAQEEALLNTYGYPYVLQRWQFHMTLTARLDAGEAPHWAARAAAHFAPALSTPAVVEDIAIFSEAAPEADLQVISRLALRGAEA